MKHMTGFVAPARVEAPELYTVWELPVANEGMPPIRVEIRRVTDEETGVRRYQARSRHPLTHGLTWVDHDLGRLEQTVREDLAQLCSEEHRQEWAPAIAVRTRSLSRLSNGVEHIGFDLAISPLRVAQSTQGRKGCTHITKSGEKVSVFAEKNAQYALADETAATTRRRPDSTAGRSAILLDADDPTIEALQGLAGTLHLFAQQLSAQLSPGPDGTREVPSPQALVETMRRAAEMMESRTSPG
ncbi:hypothetical protein [Rhodovulum adriaticum]|uniref:Uncharacterized protein n=1 Tax=Rhodovulum adriaticum TaxID=35804 RepID=A0A4R2NLE2_RHOAD|nr:hypothetical protein [Rhodovulum adriaticum]MBK1635998.1 hypothetical protein [Rhodovulum adriaticum]TCP22429.1 hypothetical protein EV656_10615 [Rhodovulum adriaticum]